jgi:hypothetical protein
MKFDDLDINPVAEPYSPVRCNATGVKITAPRKRADYQTAPLGFAASRQYLQPGWRLVPGAAGGKNSKYFRRALDVGGGSMPKMALAARRSSTRPQSASSSTDTTTC